MSTVVALFRQFDNAERALDGLLANGFDLQDISVVIPDRRSRKQDVTEAQPGARVVPGALANAGGVTPAPGTLGIGGVTLNGTILPGVGKVQSAGPLFSGADPNTVKASEAAPGGDLAQALIDRDIPANLSQLYAEGVRRGNLLLAVDADRIGDAKAVMNQNNAADVEALAREWQREDRQAG